jgi:hypothetical protein
MTPPAAGATRSLDLKAPPKPRRVTPRHPRRVSGPARPNAQASSGGSRSATAMALPAPGVALPTRRPRRTSAPSRRRPAKPGSTQNPGIALRTAGALQRVSASALLDRLIRGRLWIGLLAFALIGIVAMQLVVLKLNTGIGSKLQHEALLQRENAELGIENSVYSAENRIAPLAAATGMTFAPAGTVHFVRASPDDLVRAASALSSGAGASTTTQPEATQAAVGETGASSGATSQGTAATAEAEASGSTSAGAENAGGSSESSPAASPESGTAAVSAAPSSATTASATTTPTVGAGEQTSGASAAPAGGASAPAGGAQAAPQG